MTPFGDSYRGKSVFLTGHTGFKGSWLAAWLVEMGARVSGFALPPSSSPNHWDLLELSMADERGDIRDAAALRAALERARPDIVFHLAAQSLVRCSYREPLETWSTNVLGTATVLDACRSLPGLQAVVVVTTDKVYANREWPWGYREVDRLGGHDPYSASKAATELLCDSYAKAFFQQPGAPLLATARAGNVIGGGDWSEDRLIPDLVRAVASRQSLEIRSPGATRPWQHVLDCLSGYLLLGQRLLAGQRDVAESWNFGPGPADNRAVASVLESLQSHWPALQWHLTRDGHPHEAGLLYLDSAKARSRLAWQPAWSLERALAATAEWYREQAGGRVLTQAQIADYVASAEKAGCAWACS